MPKEDRFPMEMPSSLLTAFPPSANELLDRIRPHVDDAMLMYIASTDYGQLANEMFVQLGPIRDTGVIPSPMGWLSEVLELTTWTECPPESPHMGSFTDESRFHQTRLFACAVLLVANELPECQYLDSSQDSTLARCLASTKVLGDEQSKALACFLTWQMSRTDIQSEEMLLFAFGLLALATRLRFNRFTDRELVAIAEWVLAEEGRWRLAHRDQWIYEANTHDFMPALLSVQHGFWKPLAIEFKNNVAAIHSDEVGANLLLCGLLIENAQTNDKHDGPSD